ncbi:MAG TPA: TraR/DksA C4-type zinc finger protein [Candidatus Binatia bacterium]|nr:TraR/DksA C4-type zinc finger protein [Candidatus Binatia bacterium]
MLSAVKSSDNFARLMRRKEQITATLRHVQTEQRSVEGKADSMDQLARKRRLDLLHYLNRWYLTEIDRVENALHRINQNQYGVCSACNVPIEPEWLETFPETDVCRACQELRERMEWAG